jgi:DNA repair exonuclease SbcCD ATPase subunit
MASESSSERTVSISLPSELDEWLDEQTELDREQLVVQLLTSYRTASELGDDAGLEFLLGEGAITETVEAELSEQLPGAIDDQVAGPSAEELDERIQAEVQSAVSEALAGQVSEATNTVQRRLTNRIDSVEAEFDEKIADVRERVVQIKKETDKKAPADHSHEELSEIDELSSRLAETEAELGDLRSEIDEYVPEHEDALDDVDSRLQQLQERMQTVAWVVSDLRDAYESNGGLEAVERIKRAAAKANIERADCENCGDSVTISLLTDPTCPHCDATVSNVEPSSGWFGSPTLLTASQLESGEDR